MKRFLFFLLLLLAAPFFLVTLDAQANTYPNARSYGQVLKQYVHDGAVNYSALSKRETELVAYLDLIASVSKGDFEQWSEVEQMAYLLNVYNANTLKLILDHYPIQSIKKIRKGFQGPWDQKIVSLFGKKISLNHVEHEILRKKYKEPRIHFALVCAAKGCPPLRSEPYDPNTLSRQLNDQARLFLAQKEKNDIDDSMRVVYLSPIFKWFEEDFVLKPGLLLDRVLSYDTSLSQKQILNIRNYNVEFTDYDWSLNEQSSLEGAPLGGSK